MRGLGPVILKWSGETDVTPAELCRYLGMIFAKMSMYLSMSSSFNIVESLREEWSE
jgi:ABC-type sugar transport system ATPase subunit